MARLAAFWRNLRHRDRVERDLDDEVREIFALLVDEKIRAGLGPADARRAATLELGRVETVKDSVRDVRAGAFADTLVLDVRYAVRLLQRDPLFALTAALSLAIGIGATTAVFTAANGLLFRTAPGVADPDRVVDVTRTNGQFGVNLISGPNYQDIRARTTTLEGVYAYRPSLVPVNVEGAGATGGGEPAFGNVVSTNYFTVLGVRPAIGRVFEARENDQLGADPIVVLSHQFWTRRFNADPAIVGQTVRLNTYPYSVIGVAREGFLGTTVIAPDLWVPSGARPFTDGGVNVRFAAAALVGGRLKPNVSRAQAAAEIDAIGRALEQEYPDENRGYGLSVSASSPIPAGLRLVAAGFLALLLAIVSLVLGIACANVAGVLLARGTIRRREIAVRLAMGVGRWRLVRQLLTETWLLFVLGGAAGLLLAREMLWLLLRALPSFAVPVNLSLPLDVRVVAFTTGVSLVAAVLSGLAPALHASKVDVVSALKQDVQGPSDRLRLRSAFVVAQVAFSILLVVIAGLLVRALDRTSSVEQGFDPHGVEVTSLDLTTGGYTSVTGSLFAGELVERARTLPGVQSATLAFGPATVAGGMGMSVSIPGVTPDGSPFFFAGGNIVEPGFFSTMRIPLVAGRDFTAADRDGAEPVAIVSESAVRRFWPGTRNEEALGRTLVSSGGVEMIRPPSGPRPQEAKSEPRAAPRTVIGIAGDLRSGGRGEAARPYVYLPFRQQYTPNVTLLARSTRGQRLATDLRALVATMNPKLPVVSSQPLDEQGGPIIMQLRIAAAVAGSVGIVGLLLASIGIYGVTAYTVARRSREIGIRIAMGAQRADVVRLVLGQGMSLVALGSAIGLALAAVASRLLARLLYGIGPVDPVAFLGAAVLFGAIGLVACDVPVRRATNVDAMEALRYE